MKCPIKRECHCAQVCHHDDMAEYCSLVRDHENKVNRKTNKKFKTKPNKGKSNG